MELKGKNICLNDSCGCKIFGNVKEEFTKNETFINFQYPSLRIAKSDLIELMIEARKQQVFNQDNNFLLVQNFDEPTERKYLKSLDDYHDLLSYVYFPSAVFQLFSLGDLPCLAGKKTFFRGKMIKFFPRIFLPKYFIAFEFFTESEKAFAFCLSKNSIPNSLAVVIRGEMIYEFRNITPSQTIQSFIEECIRMACENFEVFRPIDRLEKESFDQIHAFLMVEHMKIPLPNEMKNVMISCENVLGRLHNSLYYSGLPALMTIDVKDLCFHADFTSDTLDVFLFQAGENPKTTALKYHFIFSEDIVNLSCQKIERDDDLSNIFPILISQDNPYFNFESPIISREFLSFPGGTAIIKRTIQAILDMMKIFAGNSHNFYGFDNEHEEEIAICFQNVKTQHIIKFILDSQTIVFIDDFPGAVAVFELDVSIKGASYLAIFTLGKTECFFTVPHQADNFPLEEIDIIPEFYKNSFDFTKNSTVKELFQNASLKQIQTQYCLLNSLISPEYLDLIPIKRWVFDRKVTLFPTNYESFNSSMMIIQLIRLIEIHFENSKAQLIEGNENFILIELGNMNISLLRVGEVISDAFQPLPKYIVKSRCFHFSEKEEPDCFCLHEAPVKDFFQWYKNKVSQANVFEDLIREVTKIQTGILDMKLLAKLTSRISNLFPRFKIVQSYNFLYEMLLAFVRDFKFGYFPFEGKKTKIFPLIPGKVFEISNSSTTFYIVHGVIDFEDEKLTWIGIPFFAKDKVHYYDFNGEEMEISLLNNSIESIFHAIPSKTSVFSARKKFYNAFLAKRWKDLVQVFQSCNYLQLWSIKNSEEYFKLSTLKSREFLALIGELDSNDISKEIIQNYISNKNKISCDNSIDLIDILEELTQITNDNRLEIFKEIQVTREFELEHSLAPSDAKIFRIFNSLWIINPIYSAKYLNYHSEFGIWFNCCIQGERSLETNPLKMQEILTKNSQNENLSHLIGLCKKHLNFNVSSLPALENQISFLFDQVFQVKPYWLEISYILLSPVANKKEFVSLLKQFLSQKSRESCQITFDQIVESWYSITMPSSIKEDSFHQILVNFSPFEIFICANANSFERKKPQKYSIFLNVLLSLLLESKPLNFRINSEWFLESEKAFTEGNQLPAANIWIPFMEREIVNFFLKIFKAQYTRLDPMILDEIPLHPAYKNSIIFALNHHQSSPIQIKVHPNIISPIMALANGMQIDENLTLFSRCKQRQFFFILPNGHEYSFKIPGESSKQRHFKSSNNPLRMSILQTYSVFTIFSYFKELFHQKFYENWTLELDLNVNVNYFIQNPKLFQFMVKKVVEEGGKFIKKISQFSSEVQMHFYNHLQCQPIEDEEIILELLATFIVHFPSVKQVKPGNGWICISFVNSKYDTTIIGYNSYEPINVQIPPKMAKMEEIMQLIFWQESKETLSPKEHFIVNHLGERHVPALIRALDDERKKRLIEFMQKTNSLAFSLNTPFHWNSFSALMNGIEWQKLLWSASFEAPFSLFVSLEATATSSHNSSAPKSKSIQLNMNTKGKSLLFSEAIEHFTSRYLANQNKQTPANQVPDANYQAMFDKFF